jgi:hypothetical protein
MKLTTTCNHCKGTGTVEVTGVYLETLHGLRRLTKAHGYTTAAKSAEWFGCSATALNNRLSWLERHGFASSTKFGRERRYSAK